MLTPTDGSAPTSSPTPAPAATEPTRVAASTPAATLPARSPTVLSAATATPTPATTGAEAATCPKAADLAPYWPPRGIVGYQFGHSQMQVDVGAVPLEQTQVLAITCGNGRGRGTDAYIAYRVPPPTPQEKVRPTLLAALDRWDGQSFQPVLFPQVYGDFIARAQSLLQSGALKDLPDSEITLCTALGHACERQGRRTEARAAYEQVWAQYRAMGQPTRCSDPVRAVADSISPWSKPSPA